MLKLRSVKKPRRLLIILCLFSISCTQLSPKFPIYGNWCGPGHPGGNNYPMPIDIIDDACRGHDLCYRQHGFFERKCDTEFVQNLREIAYLSKNKSVVRRNMLNYMSTNIYGDYYFD